MENKTFGIRLFAVAYNMFGLLSLTACIYGFQSIALANSLIIGQKDYTQIVGIFITVMFFASSYLLISHKKIGYFIPIFLLSFLVAGGFIILLPILIFHIIYFTQREINERFS